MPIKAKEKTKYMNYIERGEMFNDHMKSLDSFCQMSYVMDPFQV